MDGVTNIGLGPYPIVTLAEARKKAVANRRTIEAGLDPRGSRVPSFCQATEKVIAIHAAGWKPGGKSEKQWRSSLSTYAYPRLGRRPVDRITTADVMACLLPIWHTRPETARRVRQRIGAVMRWAIAQGYRTGQPSRGRHHRGASLQHGKTPTPPGAAPHRRGGQPRHRPSLRRLSDHHLGVRVPNTHSLSLR